MRAFLAARAGHAALVVFIAATLSFALLRVIPGGPADSIDDLDLSRANREALHAQWHLDEPLWRQYAMWVGDLATGDLGMSFTRGIPVAEVLAGAVPNTLLLTVPAALLGVLAGVLLGTWQAARPGAALTRATDMATLVVISVPDFVIAVLLASVFAFGLGLVPSSGMVDVVLHESLSPLERVADLARHMVLPLVALSIAVAAPVSRYQRASVMSVLREDYVRTARAKGVPPGRILMRHVLRNSLGPVIAIVGLLIPAMFAGAVFVESVFSWPGMGSLLVESVTRRDYNVVQAIVLVGSVLVVLGGVLTDAVSAAVNPRVARDR